MAPGQLTGPSLPPTVLGAAGRPHLTLSTLEPSRTPVWSLCAPTREWHWHTLCSQGWGTKESSARARCTVRLICVQSSLFLLDKKLFKESRKNRELQGLGEDRGGGRVHLDPLSPVILSASKGPSWSPYTYSGAGSGSQGSCSSFWGLRYLGTKKGSKFRCWGCPEDHVSSKTAQRAQAVGNPQGAGIVQRARKLRPG